MLLVLLQSDVQRLCVLVLLHLDLFQQRPRTLRHCRQLNVVQVCDCQFGHVAPQVVGLHQRLQVVALGLVVVLLLSRFQKVVVSHLLRQLLFQRRIV